MDYKVKEITKGCSFGHQLRCRIATIFRATTTIKPAKYTADTTESILRVLGLKQMNSTVIVRKAMTLEVKYTAISFCFTKARKISIKHETSTRSIRYRLYILNLLPQAG
jgi:hypothetical protein